MSGGRNGPTPRSSKRGQAGAAALAAEPQVDWHGGEAEAERPHEEAADGGGRLDERLRQADLERHLRTSTPRPRRAEGGPKQVGCSAARRGARLGPAEGEVVAEDADRRGVKGHLPRNAQKLGSAHTDDGGASL